MLGGRAKLPVLAEISGPAPEATRAWSLRRQDFERLAALQPRLAKRRAALVTGGEEATRVAAVALAAAASATGRRTVLLECDLARPRLAADLGLAQAPGLHEYLCWEATPAEVLQPVALGGSAAAGATGPLVCIAAGRAAPQPETLLGLPSFLHMTAKLRSAYDFVVLAGPGIGSEDGALRIVSGQADVVIVGLSPAQVSGRDGRPLRAAVRRLPTPSLGAVVVGEA
jgi:Mrp family chromosome partitioning ATPase